jgi:hypothetical protein
LKPSDDWLALVELAAELRDVACFATTTIYRDGAPIQYMDRDPDGQWAFIAKNDSDAFVNDANNVAMCSLREIAIGDPAIVPFLDAPPGSSFSRTADDRFEAEESPPGYGLIPDA